MPDSLQDSVKRIMGDILELDPSEIPSDSQMGSLGQWDSGNHVRLVLALEEEFNISFEISEIEDIVSLQKLLSTLQNKL